MTGSPDDADRVRTLREALTATGAGIYLATHVAGPLSAETLAAVHESDELELRIGRVGPDRAEDLEQREWEARAAVAATIKAPFEQVVLSHGAAEAARCITLELLRGPGGSAQPGSSRRARQLAMRVVTVEGLAEPVARAVGSVARALGAEVDHLPVVPQILGSDVALVAMPHVDPLGRLHDPGPVASTTQRAGARLLVDVSLSVGALPLDVAEMGADALVGDVQRWLLGPEGLALAWLSPALGDDVPARLRATTGPFARGSLLALARSVGWLLMYVELPWVVARTGRLARRLYGSLAGIHGVELVGRTGCACGPAGVPHRRLGRRAGRRGALAQRLRHRRRGRARPMSSASALAPGTGRTSWTASSSGSRSWPRTPPPACRAGRR